MVTAIERGSYIVYLGGIVLVLFAREGRRRWRLSHGVVRVHHANGRTLTVPLGQTLLEAFREARIPHAAVCGGRARCTTCRVRVGVGLEHLPPAQPAERQALARINAEVNVRLACQARPAGDCYVTPLVRADASAAFARQPGGVRGREKRVVVMFVDLRESSRLGEERLPYDVIFILNRFFAEMAEALRETDGYYSTFNGDGLMALYGTEGELQRGARNAMRGAMLVSARLATLNRTLASELRRPLRIGIGLHAGEAIVGTMGPPATPILSALGDTVNVAARLEQRTRDHDCELVVSAECAQAAAVDLSLFPAHEVVVRGRRTTVKYYAIPDPAALRPLVSELENA
jgi:adenylate cyclase